MTPEREKELNNKGSTFTLAEEEECMNAIATFRKQAASIEKALNGHWERRFFLLTEDRTAAIQRAEKAERRCKLLEEEWLKAAFAFRKHHKAVLEAIEKI